jgi:hypothetical protein
LTATSSEAAGSPTFLSTAIGKGATGASQSTSADH